jgi:SAM-dependent methyltransferase
MTADPPAPENFELRNEFGNAEANLRFLATPGVLPHGARILEIGTGRGALLRYLLQQGHAVQGAEVNADRIEESRRLYGALPITQVQGVTLPFPDGAFDIVLSFDVFEHIRDSEGHLREVRRVLAPGGRYLLQTPNKWSNTVFETLRWRSFTSWRADHCALHSYGQLRRRLRRHGFDVTFHDVPVVTDFFRRKVAHYMGTPGRLLLTVANPDRLPLRFRTNFYAEARRG